LGVLDEVAIQLRYAALGPVLDERGRRRFAAAEARSAGWGGVSALSRITGMARSTIGRGLAELRGTVTDDARYPAGVKVSDAEMADLKLTPHAFHGEWNYTIEPRPPP
jgi:hypothetical protein